MSNSVWANTIGRVAFLNCDPLYHNLGEEWNVLPAPPAWLSGHLLRKDCIMAPIPAADYARNADELVLIPDIGICSKGEVGSVLVFSNKELSQLQSVALPSDSATSVALLKHLFKLKGLTPEYSLMGPDFDGMLEQCDGCLLIGDRALEAAKLHPQLVKLDLGKAWLEHSGSPMVFGVFAARKDSPIEDVKKAHAALLDRLVSFEQSDEARAEVIRWSMSRSDLSFERLDQYFGEVFNRLDNDHITGLDKFLKQACELEQGAEFAW